MKMQCSYKLRVIVNTLEDINNLSNNLALKDPELSL